MGRVVQFQIKNSKTLDDHWQKVSTALDKYSGMAIRVSDDEVELHISDDIDRRTLLGLLEIFKTQISPR